MSPIRILAAGATALTLAGCAISNEQAVPDDVMFVGNRLNVFFSNGMQCYSDNIVGTASGTFEHCPIPVRYDVIMHQRTRIAVGLVEPFADITVTKPDGRWKLLKTPGSRNWTAHGVNGDDDSW